MNKSNQAIKYISHGIYLQIFLGIILLILREMLEEYPEFLTQPTTLGGMLILLGINSGIYIQRYKKTLKDDNTQSHRTASTRSGGL